MILPGRTARLRRPGLLLARLVGRVRHDFGRSFVSFLVTDKEIRGRRQQPRLRSRLPCSPPRRTRHRAAPLLAERDARPPRPRGGVGRPDPLGPRRGRLVGALDREGRLGRRVQGLRRRFPRRPRLRAAGGLPRGVRRGGLHVPAEGLLLAGPDLRLRRLRRRPGGRAPQPGRRARRRLRREVQQLRAASSSGARRSAPGTRTFRGRASSTRLQAAPVRWLGRLAVDGSIGEEIDFAGARRGHGGQVGGERRSCGPPTTSSSTFAGRSAG